MKKIICVLSLITFGISSAQSPQGINYQATIRSSAGELLINQNAGIKFTVHQEAADGQAIYSEQHTTTTDNIGAVKLVFGQGTPETGTFNQINWAIGSYYLEIEVNTGSGFTSLGTTQLMSVPYALYAERSGSSFSVNIIQKTGNMWDDLNGNGFWDNGEDVEYKYLDINTDISPGDNENFIDEGYVIGLTPEVDVDNNVYYAGEGAEQFSENNGMLLNTVYYIRGWAKKIDNSYVYGKSKQITTF